MRELDIFRRLQHWLGHDDPVWLCTVLATWGSSPRPAGSLLACNARGDAIGSLSGGCVEEQLLAQIAAGQFVSPVSRIRYGESAEEAARLNLPCGGILDVAIERWLPGQEQRDAAQAVVVALEQRKCVLLVRDFIAGTVTVSPDDGHRALVVDASADGTLRAISQPLGPAFRLLLLGVSEVSRAVAQLALLLDYDVLVCDPRAEARARWDIAGVTLIAGMPDDAVRDWIADTHSAVLALTHDPRIDDMGLLEAFSTPASYIGAMGSLRTSQNRRERLRELDVSDQQLQRLHAPIGLDTGSKTPMEIAVSVMAQLTAVRSGKLA